MSDAERFLNEWRAKLEQQDEDIAERERRLSDATADELESLASLREKAAAAWDELADRYDAWARERDHKSLGRDKIASSRDVASRKLRNDLDPGFGDRSASGVNRDDSAGDRGGAYDDRERSSEARERAGADRKQSTEDRQAATKKHQIEVGHLQRGLKVRGEIGQAIGLVMAQKGLSSDDAFALLVKKSRNTNTKLHDLATSIVYDAQPDD